MLTFVRYVLVQLASYALDMGGFLLLYRWLEFDPVIANLTGKLGAGFLAFAAHRLFTFRMRGRGDMRWQATRYFALLALNTPLSSAILSMLLWIIPPPTVAKLAADVLCVGITFSLTRIYVFRHASKSPRLPREGL
jgi:putative flippase GtrA